MTTLEQFENNIKTIISVINENFDSIGAGKEEFFDDTVSIEELPQQDNIIATGTTEPEQTVIPIEKPPKFRVYWRAWKDGNSTSGQTESVLDTDQMARAESMSKLYDLGFTDIEILAIETIKSNESLLNQI